MGTGAAGPAFRSQQQAARRDLSEPAIAANTCKLSSLAGLEIKHAVVFEAVEDGPRRCAHGAAAVVIEGVDLEDLPGSEAEGVLVEKDLVVNDDRVHEVSAVMGFAGLGVVFPQRLARGGVELSLIHI